MHVEIMRLDPGLPTPTYAHDGDAGLDLMAREVALLHPGGGRATIPTGIAIALPPDHVGLIAPRSGLAANHGVTVLNAPGIVDSGYRGEIAVILVNLSCDTAYTVKRGERIAQLVITPFTAVTLAAVETLPRSARGKAGLGTTGA